MRRHNCLSRKLEPTIQASALREEHSRRREKTEVAACLQRRDDRRVNHRPEGGRMPSTITLDTCGRRRSPATLSSFHQGRAPRNKRLRYPADPPTVEEIVGVMRAAGQGATRLGCVA